VDPSVLGLAEAAPRAGEMDLIAEPLTINFAIGMEDSFKDDLTKTRIG
jgi:hypothetical protein